MFLKEKTMSHWLNFILIIASAFLGFIYSVAVFSLPVNWALTAGIACAGIGYMLMRSRESGYRKVRLAKDIKRIKKCGRETLGKLRKIIPI